MTNTNTSDPWETGELGNSLDHAVVADDTKLDAALGLKMISIRLDESLIAELKMIAALQGVGYQPLIRDVLKRFTAAEMKQLLIERFNEVVAHKDKKAA